MMQSYPFIDITGDDAIQSVMDDPRNFFVQAIKAETVLEWVPDLGQFAAKASCRAQNGIFRTPGLANSGIPAVLRHRFAKPAESDRAVGTHYVGLLIFDSEQDDYTFELSCGSEVFGAIHPWRHDNRRHLVILSQSVTILEAFYAFSIKAVGKGPCYLESIVFLSELPLPTSYAPIINRFSSNLVESSSAGVSVQVDFITREAASITMSWVNELGEKEERTYARFESLHSYKLEKLAADHTFRLLISAKEVGGEVDEKTFDISTHLAPKGAGKRQTIPVNVCRTGAGNYAGFPLTFGLPFKYGETSGEMGWRLRGGDQIRPAQSRVLSRWEDGSARWILFDASYPEILEGEEIVKVWIEGDLLMGNAAGGLRWNELGHGLVVEGERVRVGVTAHSRSGLQMERMGKDGIWRQVFNQTGPLLEGHLADGHLIKGSVVENLILEETGSERVVIRFEMAVRDGPGIEHIRATIRLHIYARQSFIRFSLRLVVTSPLLGQAYRSHDLNHLTPDLEYARGAVAGESGESTALLRLADLEMHLPLEMSSISCRVHQIHDRAHVIQKNGETHLVNDRWSGPMVIENGDKQIAFGLRDFWQNYPKALRVDRNEIAVEVFPRIDTDDWPNYAEEWWRLYFWLDAERKNYRLKAGMAFTTEMFFGVPEDTEEAKRWQDWLNTPPAVRPEIDYLNESGALLAIAPKNASVYSQYEGMVDKAQTEWLRCRDESHEYGLFNFGDYYNRRETFWGNNEYDSAFSHLMEFLRGGEPGWSLLAVQAIRHLVDIDTCNFSRNPDDIGRQYIHTQGHIGGYLPPQYRNKMGESESMPSHSWVEGAVLQYLLGGDESIRETIVLTGKHFTEGLQHYDFTNARESGWQIIHLCALARMSATQVFTNAAAIIVEKILEKQEPGGGWVHNLSQAHCWCDPPRCRGEAGFMVGVLLSSLRRYYELTQDSSVAEAIVGGALWLVRETFVSEAGLFKYTSCQSRVDPKIDFSVMVVEGLADASVFTHNPAVLNALEQSLTVIGESNLSNTDLPRYGKDLLIESRYVPTMLSILANASGKSMLGY